ncbi:hypothetical protein CY35_01G049100 [Sphagnum magellanicum]|nr:hypothetical protein CY35_01G049100 [Sphagnum magellanicum]
MAGKTVCLTGAEGFIGSWILKTLLDHGYTVRGTVRNLGCDGVFHTASPVLFKDITDPQAEVIDPAVNGTLNVLASCAKAQTKKVVLTSSISAIIFTNKRNSKGGIDESLWSDEDYCRENKMWYFLSKTLAEKAAWDFANEKGLNMVAIQPVTVLGSPLQASPNYGLEVIRDYLNGTIKTCRDIDRVLVGVKDMARAHILAYESPHATGRNICCSTPVDFDLGGLLTKLYPTYPIAAKDDEAILTVPLGHMSTDKLNELGFQYQQPIEDAISGVVTSLKEHGWLA